MAAQVITITKIGGVSADIIYRQFESWQDQVLELDEKIRPWDCWPKQVTEEADDLAELILAHRTHLPVVFHAEFVDSWSSCPPDRYLGHLGLLQVNTPNWDIFCLRLPAEEEVVNEMLEVKRAGQHFEDRFFAENVCAAFESWKELVPNAVLLFTNQIYRGGIEDHEITASLEAPPSWLVDREEGSDSST